jgi:DNA adenine methylase
MKPLLKWAGGKRHIAMEIQRHFPNDWNKGTYFEPFLGGAAIFLEIKPNKSELSDVNTKLIRFYKDVKGNPRELFNQIETFASSFDDLETPAEKKEFYLELRESFNANKLSVASSAQFFVLNKICFNGLYRENKRGYFNVPFGQKTKFPAISLDDFLAASKALRHSKLQVSDFEVAIENAVKGDFVYFDPPYVPVNPTANFTAYSSEGFGLDEQKRLAQLMKELKKRGVKALLSNSSTQLTEEIFGELKQVKISAPRMVSAKSSSRGNVDELLIMNY